MNKFVEHVNEICNKVSSFGITENDIWYFDPKISYPAGPYTKALTERQQTLKLGIMSNLIADMALKGASKEELIRAVKHSLVIMDQRKHLLDWERSEIENRILELKRKYQGVQKHGS